MWLQVLVVQSDSQQAAQIVDHLTDLGDQVFQADTLAEAQSLLRQHEPELVVVDAHLLDDTWHTVLIEFRQSCPDSKLLFTSSYPDPQRETTIKENYGAPVVLRSPFTRTSLEQALRDLEGDSPIETETRFKAILPKIKFPVRTKITLPYIILALVLAIAAAYVVNQIVLDTVEERFTNQLIETGKLASDWTVNEEGRLLETLRLIAYTNGVPQAVESGDAERIRSILLPLAVNYQEEAVEILDAQGTSLLSLRHIPGGGLEDYESSRGENLFAQWDFVQNVLGQTSKNPDKYSGLGIAPWGNYLYVSGPLFNDNGDLVGVILIGKSLETLVRQIRQDTLSHVTIYGFDGRPMASTFISQVSDSLTLEPATVSQVLEQQDKNSLIRSMQVASIDYSELAGPWELSRAVAPPESPTANDLGLMGVSLAQTFLVKPGQVTRVQIFALTAVTILLIILTGVYIANRISRPLLTMVAASAEVAHGNLDVQVDPSGNDEVGVLAHSFNEMVAGLREGSIYRDLFGRTVSPEVREQLRQGFATGDVNLEGQEVMATVLMSDIRGFTTIAETENPTTVMKWLNEYFEELVPIINNYGGVISKFEGDAVLAFFGILPRPLPPQESAYRACQTALDMLDAIHRLNVRRAERGDPPFKAGVGVNTGPVMAGALGSSDRLHYTIIGDTVNATARLESLTRQFGEGSVAVISQHTLFALRDKHQDFNLESMGAHNVKGKVEQLIVYRLVPPDDNQ